MKLLYKHTSCDWGEAGLASFFAWALILPTFAGIGVAKIPKKLWESYHKFRAEVEQEKAKALPPIHIQKGAKIKTMDEYKELKQLCIDFEVEFEASQEVNKLIMDI